MKETLILLYGGRSAEREVSVLTAESVMRAVDYNRFHVKTYFISSEGKLYKTQEFTSTPTETEKLMTNDQVGDLEAMSFGALYEKDAVIFPLLHGPMGEDGSIQGFFEILGMPYVGAGILTSSMAMDKISTKRILESVGITQVPYTTYIEGEDLNKALDEAEARLTYPVFVKPSNMGSSVGISRAEDRVSLEAAIQEALRYDSRILVEQGVDAREIEVAILGNQDIQTTLPGEVVKDVAFYDYQAKYIDNKIEMAIPAQIPDDVTATMREEARKAYYALGGTGLSRCDFFYTEDGKIYLNELNTMPGFTQWSMYPLLWKNMGLSYSDLISTLVDLAIDVYNKRQSHFF
ncbi:MULTISPECIES: D-alanine--D-alanine ligase [unclassified Streptococcus]|uniref:D-alanine--D-alanine ligase n=1 Tax=unclassified Streptococcus TaxID=2608887 RepID=UPI001072ED03|nr:MULTISPECIES: D-alanine--D-alanine ligase [unclassified Streptococcus]MBF0805653.1 D-alanine--D-alanine ligase [Streptococcus sp. 19428wA2_WM07]TFU28827.1 D-alanine--D-alanine ligase [Streptococcus sp. WM07]